jgi:translation initiation factor IF-2
MTDKGVRIYDLARRLAVPSRELINMLKKRGIEVTSHMSSVNSETANLILETFGAKKPGEAKKAEMAKHTPSKPKQRKKPEIEPSKKRQRRQLQTDQPEKQEKPYQRGKPRKGQYRESDQTYTKDKLRGHVSRKGREGVSRSRGLFKVQEEETGFTRKTERGLVSRRYDKSEGYHRRPGRERERAPLPGQVPQAHIEKPRKKSVKKVNVSKKPEKVLTPEPEVEELPIRLRIPEVITVKELAEDMKVPPAKVIRHLMTMGIMANVNQVLETKAAMAIAETFGFEVETTSVDKKAQFQEEVVDESRLRPRPPVVTIMGHVDHGKTTLLDAIRESKITDSEFGGITQHIGAYVVDVEGQKIVFLDTPGHEAFTAMRARGAQVTDEVVLVVAADDGIMPQTVEAIDHARAADVPIIAAINKIDAPGANPERVMQELTKYGLTPEAWGGETICVQVSAKERTNLDELLEMILLQAEMLELRADPVCPARGVVVEAMLDKGRGPVATVLVQNGTLQIGDPFVAGLHHGRVRAMLDDRGRRVKEVGPATPVEVLGLTGVPVAGDSFVVVDNERKARQIAETRQEQQQKTEFLKTAKITLEELHHHIKEGQIQELRIVIKADVHGSVEALSDALERLSTEQVRLQVIHGGVGAINESDVMLAAADTNVIILGFNVRPVAKAQEMAEKEQIDVRLYTIIYQAIDDIKKAMEGLLQPTYKEVLQGQAVVQALFSVPKVGTVAGCRVTNGKITRNSLIRVLRDKQEEFKGNVTSLRRVKDDVREVLAGYECGIKLENFDDIHIDDIIEAYTIEKITMTLEQAAARKIGD